MKYKWTYIYLQKTIFISILFYPNTYATLCDISFVFFSFVNQKKQKKKNPLPSIRKLRDSPSQGGSGNANTLQLLASRRSLKSSTEAKTLVTDSFHFLVGMAKTARQMWEQAFTQESSKETKRQAFPWTETRAASELLGKRVGRGVQKNSNIWCHC